MASEKTIERKLRQGVEDLGGMCIKLLSILFKGLPDRLILLPGARVCFVETKSTGDTQSPMQKHITKRLRALGFDVYVVDTEEKLKKLLTLWSSSPTITKNML